MFTHWLLYLVLTGVFGILAFGYNILIDASGRPKREVAWGCKLVRIFGILCIFFAALFVISLRASVIPH